jgi:hypothetical protein
MAMMNVRIKSRFRPTHQNPRIIDKHFHGNPLLISILSPSARRSRSSGYPEGDAVGKRRSVREKFGEDSIRSSERQRFA